MSWVAVTPFVLKLWLYVAILNVDDINLHFATYELFFFNT